LSGPYAGAIVIVLETSFMDEIFVFLAFTGLLFLGTTLVLLGVLLEELARSIFRRNRKARSRSAPQEEVKAERSPMLLVR